MDGTKAGEEAGPRGGAGLRCEQVCGFTAAQEWEQVQVHSCGVRRQQAPALPPRVETLNHGEGRAGVEAEAGWGVAYI